MRLRLAAVAALAGALSVASLATVAPVAAQDGPEVVDPNLVVDTAVSGVALPTSIAFLGDDDLLVLEKNTGQVLHVVDGSVTGTAIDLAVNNFSERGLLGIALHPDFPDDPGVYLYWTCRTDDPPADPFVPDEETCSDDNMLGADTGDVLRVPLLANRIDRFTWNAATSTLTFDHRLITIRQFQNDASPQPPGQGDDATGPHGAQPARGNHDGGIITFGPDGKLYAYVGDAGRRGAIAANLPSGPEAAECDGPEDVTPDDQFGGPEADDAHFTGVILRLNDDGSTPSDNPFFAAGASMGGEVGENLQQVFAYGMRNSFGMAFDPIGGGLWEQENGEDAFDELNLVDPGMNNGWIQIQGPSTRIDEFRAIETTSLHAEDFPNLQQFRWGPERIATSPAEALSRLYVIPGSHYSEPEFSWKHVIAPAAIGFIDGSGLGRQYRGDLLVGMSVPVPDDGVLLRFNLTGNRQRVAVDDPRLEDRVADNTEPNDLTESESLLFGTGFGVVTDVETAPDGSVWVVSLSNGAIYRIAHR